MANSTMTSNMPTSDKNKLITATLHPVEHHFAVPNDWDLEDITYESGILFYKGKKQYVPKVVDDGECKDLDKLEEGNWMDFDVYFDCEEFDLYKYEEEEEDKEDWFNQQSFKGTSWNYVLDEAEKHFKCSLNSEMNNKERIIHDCLYKLWNKLKEEEEEEEE